MFSRLKNDQFYIQNVMLNTNIQIIFTKSWSILHPKSHAEYKYLDRIHKITINFTSKKSCWIQIFRPYSQNHDQFYIRKVMLNTNIQIIFTKSWPILHPKSYAEYKYSDHIHKIMINFTSEKSCWIQIFRSYLQNHDQFYIQKVMLNTNIQIIFTKSWLLWAHSFNW